MSHVTSKLLGSFVAIAALAVATSAWAVADAGAKARGDFSGNGFSGGSSYGYYSAPSIARVPATSERRSLSVEPSAPASGGCGAATAKAVAPAPNATVKKDTTAKKEATTAKKDTTTRSYSVEPAAPRYYSAPSRSSAPLYLLPKSDSRKFGGG